MSLTNDAAGEVTPVSGSVSIGTSVGKTLVMKTGALASTLVTADQVILTYTVTAGKTFYLEYFDVTARLTVYAATSTLFGSVSLETPSGTKVYTTDIFSSGASLPISIFFSEPVPVAAGTAVRLVCTPSAVTAFSWKGNFGGYEK